MIELDPTVFATKTCRADDGTQLEYYVHPPEGDTFQRAIVYIHGLVSDVSWFNVPENLPPETAIVFVPRQPRTHVERFEVWRDNYASCIADFRAHHDCRFCHLIAQCYGTMPATHLAITRPETFDTMTLACPPVELQREFSLWKKLRILFGAARGAVNCELTPRSYGRSPALQRFIDENPSVTWEFTNQFYRQTNRLRRWIKREMINFPAPTHLILATEDKVAKPKQLHAPSGQHELPDRTTVLYSDHFFELLPCRRQFWDAVFDFQLQHEPNYVLDGKIETILVTGATGLVGSNLVRKLHNDGYHIVVLTTVAQRAKKQFNELDRVDVRAGNLLNLDSLERALEGVEAVIHLAGHVSDWDTYESFERVNVQGTQNILLLAHEAGIKQFIHMSSLGVFGDTDQDHFDENHRYRLSSDFYSNTKIYGEIAVRKYCNSNDIPFAIVRPGFIYGDGDKKFMPTMIKRLQAGLFRYVGSPEINVNTGYVGNVVELVAALVGNPKSFGETYNIADPQPTTAKQFVERICDEINVPKPTKVANKPLVLGLVSLFELVYRTLGMKFPPPLTRKQVTFVARSRSVDPSKAYALLGREPYSFDEGMSRTLQNSPDSSPPN